MVSRVMEEIVQVKKELSFSIKWLKVLILFGGVD